MMRHLSLLAVLGLLIFSCAETDTESSFVRKEDAENGFYLFKLDMPDSLCSCDFSFYFKAEQAFAGSKRYDIPMDVSWISPSSKTVLKERVYVSGNGNREQMQEYRSGVRLSETGEWTIQVYPRDLPSGFQGLGLTVKRNGAR